MRSSKRYSNVGFTKRVDHDGGRHRAACAPAEPASCPDCGAVYLRRRWHAPGTVAIQASERLSEMRCPACQTIQSAIPGGYVFLEGGFLRTHQYEVRHLVENEAARALEDNPLGRLMSWKEEPDGKVTVTTTTEHLAQRLGRALEKAFAGDVRYDFSHENKLARVYWRRD